MLTTLTGAFRSRLRLLPSVFLSLATMAFATAAHAAPPTVTVNQAASQTDPTGVSPIVFEIVFSEPVTGLSNADFLSASTAGGNLQLVLAGSGATYTASISGMTTAGNVVISLPAGVAHNAAAEGNLASTSTDNIVAWVPIVPTVTVNQASTQADPTSTSPIVFDIVFSEPVTGLSAADFLSASTAGGNLQLVLAGSGATYTASISQMTTAGNVVISLPAGAAQDADGNSSLASTSTDNIVAWVPDTTPPTVTVNQASAQADPTNTSPIVFDIVFSEPVTGLTNADFLSLGTAGGNLQLALSGSGTTYTASISGMTSAGSVIIALPAAAAQDAGGNSNLASSSTDNTVTWSGALVPTVSGVSPSSGSMLGGTTVTISGTGLSGATSVSFGGIAATGFNVVSANTITATTPAHAIGTVDVVVATPGGTGTLVGGYAYNNAPVITLAPATLPNGQQGAAYPTQTITASGGTAPYTYAVQAGALPTGLLLSASGTITGTPTATGSFAFTVVATDVLGFTGTQAYSIFIQQAVPTISSVAPNSGPTAGGTPVTITGANFTGATSVTFGGVAATGITVVNPTTITATTPAHAQGAVNVAVTTPGGTATAIGAFTYAAPGAVRFVINNPDDGAYVFSSSTPTLNFTITTAGGTGQSANISLAPGSYALSFSAPSGTGLASASCSPATSSVNASARTAALVIASNVTTVCTIEALPSRRATVEALGAALDASSRLILANAPDVTRRLDRLNGGGGSGGTASAFGKTFASNLPFSAAISEGQVSFAMSLSDFRRKANADHRFNANGVPASLAASVEPAAGVAVTSAAADSTTALSAGRSYRFDVWVEGAFAQFDGAASSDGDFAIIHAGADYLVSDDVLIGVAIQGDWLNMDTTTGSLDSSGWLAGPYLTARVSKAFYLDLRAAWGGATFDVSPFGTYTDTVDSDRALYTGALIGEFHVGNLLIRPEARLSWYRETTDAYIDSLSVAIPSVEIKTGEVTFGPTFEWWLAREGGGMLKPYVGFDLIWTFQQDNTATAFTGAPGLDDTGVRGRIEAGLGYTSDGGVAIGGSLFYDGIGGGDYEAWGGKASLRFGF